MQLDGNFRWCFFVDILEVFYRVVAGLNANLSISGSSFLGGVFFNAKEITSSSELIVADV